MRPARLVLAGIVLLFLSSCFDPPVREELRLRFLPNGAVVATSTVHIADPDDSTNPALARRLAETRQAILDGSDAWGTRIAAADPAAERFSWEKRLGTVRSASRSAVFAEPKGLEAFFRDTSLSVSYSVDPERGVAELAIVPGTSVRATRKQREETEKTLGAWTAAVAEYLNAGQALYAYLEDHPDRAYACLGTLFGERLNEEEAKDLDELTPEERRQVDRLDEAMGKVLEVLAVPDEGAYSPDEVSQLVYDPFPARLTLKLPGAPLEVEGFLRRVPAEDGALAVPGHGFWEALRSLEGRWLSPDPVLFYIESARQEEKDGAAFHTFLEKPRQAAPEHLLPSAREVRSAVEASLKPAPLYRASWRVDLQDESEFKWEEKTP